MIKRSSSRIIHYPAFSWKGGLLFTAIGLVGCGSETNPDFRGFSPHSFQSDEHSHYLQQTNWDLDYCYNCHSNLEGSNQTVTEVSCAGSACHNDAAKGAQACNTCHGDKSGDSSIPANWAPPPGLNDGVDRSQSGVGAHSAHLTIPSGLFRPAQCSDCHRTPDRFDAAGHIKDDTPGRAEVIFSGIARARRANPTYNLETYTCSSTHCHGAGQPVWTSTESISCGDCHGLPPAPPHSADLECSLCHRSVIDENFGIIAPELHANGFVNKN